MDATNLSKFLVDKLPGTAYYIPNFVTAEEEARLIEKVYSAPKPKWKQLSNRRLQNWGGLPHPKGMIKEPLPDWLNIYVDKVASLGVFGDKYPNHVLINEYLTGQGIMPHEDGPLFYPTITTISLGSPVLLDYYEKLETEGEPIFASSTKGPESRYSDSILLERRSLLVVQDELYYKFLHGIKMAKSDLVDDQITNLRLCDTPAGTWIQRDKRISLTIRNVPLTLKPKLLFMRI